MSKRGQLARIVVAVLAGVTVTPALAGTGLSGPGRRMAGLFATVLVLWAGEFGRTVYCQGKLTPQDYGRDHHPRCFTLWMAGAGVKTGISIGETDDYSYNVTKDPVHIHDLNATILHLFGIDHTRLTYKYQGRHFRLTDVRGEVVKKALA